MILGCKCKHDEQDRLHGKGKRVHNKTLKGSKMNKATYRCTVCVSEISE
jgi:hypothetical protein